LQENQSVIGGVKVIYSRLGEKADSVIKRIISSEKQEWIVVTSDRDIEAHAWTLGSVPVSSEDFMNALKRKYLEKEVLFKDDEEEYAKPGRKGNPRKTSKKEKAIRRIRSKL